jgi:threonine-phosphate decarboxylase
VERLPLTLEEAGWSTPLERYEPRQGDLLVLGQPNNPTGHLLAPDDIVRLASSGVHVVVDESFLPFLPGADATSLAASNIERVSVICSLTKVFCVPGLRLGWLVAESALVSRISRLRDPWSVNGIAVAAASVLARQDSYLSETRRWLHDELPRMRAALSAVPGLRTSSSVAPFVLAELPEGFSAGECRAALIGEGIAVRDASTFEGLGTRWIRIGLRTAEENARIVSALSKFVGSDGW